MSKPKSLLELLIQLRNQSLIPDPLVYEDAIREWQLGRMIQLIDHASSAEEAATVLKVCQALDLIKPGKELLK